MINTFENDAAYISTGWLLQLIKRRGLEVQHILRITHKATGKVHHLVILQDKRYICDCCMGLNLGIPCRHYFTAWTSVQGLPFHIGLVRSRCVLAKSLTQLWFQLSIIKVVHRPFP